jgi:hypothetical protein
LNEACLLGRGIFGFGTGFVKQAGERADVGLDEFDERLRTKSDPEAKGSERGESEEFAG